MLREHKEHEKGSGDKGYPAKSAARYTGKRIAGDKEKQYSTYL
jgi:hypothetical protein